VAPAVLEATVNGVPQPPSGYGRLYHGTDAIPPPAALADGFAARGDNLDLQQYAEGARDTAFRGATELPANPVDEQGAAYWAGEGGYVYEIEGVPHWDVNQLLQGRVKTPGGYRGNLMSGEHDLAIPGRIPPENIRRWGKVLRTTTGKLYVGEWHDNPGFKPRP
jgi:hypothetical protein